MGDAGEHRGSERPVAHLVDRYALAEVRTRPVEVWNEPNLVQFWRGADQDAHSGLLTGAGD